MTAGGVPGWRRILVDADSGLVHTVMVTAVNAYDISQANELLHDEESDVFADSGYWCAHKRNEVFKDHAATNWFLAMMPCHRKVLDKQTPMGAVMEALLQNKARICTKVKHPFRVLKRQFGYVKARYPRLAKNTAQLHTLLALSNIWMVRRTLLKGMRV